MKNLEVGAKTVSRVLTVAEREAPIAYNAEAEFRKSELNLLNCYRAGYVSTYEFAVAMAEFRAKRDAVLQHEANHEALRATCPFNLGIGKSSVVPHEG
jgi:hypothetical protein